jgi:REP element-mobilizing transposase RayT
MTPAAAPKRAPRRAPKRAPKRRPVQLPLRARSWGGKRAGAGRKPGTGPRRAAHRRRQKVASRFPVHVILSFKADLPSLRRPDMTEVIEQCFAEVAQLAAERPFRIAHYGIQRHHVHLIAEGKDRRAIAKGIQGLSVRLARRINKRLGRRGTVFADRYFDRLLQTPRQVRACLRYVINNERRHCAQVGLRCEPGWIDPCSSGRWFDGWRELRGRAPPRDPCCPVTVSGPRTWLLRSGWRRHGLISIDEIPAQPMRRPI